MRRDTKPRQSCRAARRGGRALMGSREKPMGRYSSVTIVASQDSTARERERIPYGFENRAGLRTADRSSLYRVAFRKRGGTTTKRSSCPPPPPPPPTTTTLYFGVFISRLSFPPHLPRDRPPPANGGRPSRERQRSIINLIFEISGMFHTLWGAIRFDRRYKFAR